MPLTKKLFFLLIKNWLKASLCHAVLTTFIVSYIPGKKDLQLHIWSGEHNCNNSLHHQNSSASFKDKQGYSSLFWYTKSGIPVLRIFINSLLNMLKHFLFLQDIFLFMFHGVPIWGFFFNFYSSFWIFFISRNMDNNSVKLNFNSKWICISSSSSNIYIHKGLEGKLSLQDNSGICHFMTFFFFL